MTTCGTCLAGCCNLHSAYSLSNQIIHHHFMLCYMFYNEIMILTWVITPTSIGTVGGGKQIGDNLEELSSHVKDYQNFKLKSLLLIVRCIIFDTLNWCIIFCPLQQDETEKEFNKTWLLTAWTSVFVNKSLWSWYKMFQVF